MQISTILTADLIASNMFSIIGTIGGCILGWVLSLWSATKTRKLRCLDRFFEAIASELGEISRLPDNIDHRPKTAHFESIRRLEGFAGCVEAKHKKEWKKLGQAWLDYKNLGKPNPNEIKNPSSNSVTRTILMDHLKKLFNAANQ